MSAGKARCIRCGLARGRCSGGIVTSLAGGYRRGMSLDPLSRCAHRNIRTVLSESIDLAVGCGTSGSDATPHGRTRTGTPADEEIKAESSPTAVDDCSYALNTKEWGEPEPLHM